MPEVLRRARAEAPAITFALRQTTNTCHEELTRGAIDFLMIPGVFTSDNNPKEPLFDESFTCVVWAGNPEVGETISVAQYLDMGHVGVAFGQSLNPSVEHMLMQQGGYRRRIEVIAPNFSLLPHLLLGANRIATMHTRLAKQAAAHLPLRLLPLPVEIPGMTEMLQWPAHHTEEPGSLWLRAILKETSSHL
jgi:DNA-binding transcriptional LysR family regulator